MLVGFTFVRSTFARSNRRWVRTDPFVFARLSQGNIEDEEFTKQLLEEFEKEFWQAMESIR